MHGMVFAQPGLDGHADNNIITGNQIKNTLSLGTDAILLVMLDSLPNHGYMLNATIKGNSITHFTNALTGKINSVIVPLPEGTYITGVFAPNSVHP